MSRSSSPRSPATERTAGTDDAEPVFLATCVQRPFALDGSVEGEEVDLAGERFFRIGNVDRMPPFFMSLVSASDLWMFVASNGGLTAGRVDAESALFPYATHDKLIDEAGQTGPTTLLLVRHGDRRSLWEPFTDVTRRLYRTERNLYKHVLGDTLIFEEINHDLELAFRYSWRFSDAFGIVRTARLRNLGAERCDLDVLDGLRNLLPYGATTSLQATMSNLLDAYKRNELVAPEGLGLFTMSSTLTDAAEPSESLRTTTVWHLGLDPSVHLLSSDQIEAFRQGRPIATERDLRGRRGAHLVRAELTLAAGASREWFTVADVNQDHASVVALRNRLGGDENELARRLEADIEREHTALGAIVGRADGQQWTADRRATARHAASTLFNVMRGGTFPSDTLDRNDLRDFVRTRNVAVFDAHRDFFDALPEPLAYGALVDAAARSDDPALERICRSYLPIAFSRRHGDPSRPWNRFAIRIRHPDGRPKLDYQGNWRDIFQNWEALAHAFPDYVEGMVALFLNATTADGYNPYRVTRDGVEWEVPEPDHPWSNIGYWSDHQIVYLVKLLEISAAHHPDALDALLRHRIFSHVDVPYRIAPYEDMLEDPYATIAFDRERHRAMHDAVPVRGTDAKLLDGPDGTTLHVTMADKLLLLLVVKLANLVPGGGLWMNTQRPEWNDANNALVGKGLSVVTIAYLVRYVAFLQDLFGDAGTPLELGEELAGFLREVQSVLEDHHGTLAGSFTPRERRDVMDGLGRAGSAYRASLYRDGLSGRTSHLAAQDVQRFLSLARDWLEHTLRANRRDDSLFHSYNVLALGDDGARVDRLYEMLEGQVAVLSSGLLSAEASLELLASLRHSRLYRADQHSYVLYPDRDVPGFLEKNEIPDAALADSPLARALLARGDRRVLVRDEDGGLHFNGDLTNGRTLRRRLEAVARDEAFGDLVAAETERFVDLFERVFDHAAFTGRSGTFFAYEGLGSIYWHMVSKLLLAVQETWRRAKRDGEPAHVLNALEDAYYDVRAGLGLYKTPDVYGAVPTDPYSHTPAHAGAQQPGMTGQVKEDVLTRIGEMGVAVARGRLMFEPDLLRAGEFLDEATPIEPIGPDGARSEMLAPASVAFTCCGVPVVYRLVDQPATIEVTRSDGGTTTLDGATLDAATSREIFSRTGAVRRLDVRLPRDAISARTSPRRAASGAPATSPISSSDAGDHP